MSYFRQLCAAEMRAMPWRRPVIASRAYQRATRRKALTLMRVKPPHAHFGLAEPA